MSFDAKYLNPVAGQIGRLNQWLYGGITDSNSAAFGDTFTEMDTSGYFNDAISYGLKIGDIIYLRDVTNNQTGARFVTIVDSVVSTANLIDK